MVEAFLNFFKDRKEINLEGKKYSIVENISIGPNTTVQHAKDSSNGKDVALKIVYPWLSFDRLWHEWEMYSILEAGKVVSEDFFEGSQEPTEKLVPEIYDIIKDGLGNQVMVMELMGANLGELFKKCGGKFSLKTVLMIGDQMLKTLEFIHSRGIVHRDLKPDNLAIGRGDCSKYIYLIDFGCADKYYEGGSHVKFTDGVPFVGNYKFAAVASLMNIKQTRRCDVESLAYILVYFLKGSLPWESLDTEEYWEKRKKEEEEYGRVLRKPQEWFYVKFWTKVKEICADLPPEIDAFTSYCVDVRYHQKPDYAYLRNLLKELFTKSGFVFDYQYDWVIKENLEKSEKNENK